MKPYLLLCLVLLAVCLTCMICAEAGKPAGISPPQPGGAFTYTQTALQ